MPLLSQDEILAFTGGHPDWSWADDSISRTFQFGDFKEALGFVNRVGESAEEAGHHPDIDIRWNKVTLTLSTHSEGGLTQKDLDLANTVDTLA
jgi:4a-hydroxytetrahydrobiopterin dehydratase